MTDFLDKGYDIPEPPSNYMRFEEGTNRFRVLSSAITGFLYWTEDAEGKRKPNRVKTYEELPADTGNENPKHFWAFAVYNHKTQSIQILEITQVTLQRQIKALVANPKWGNPKDYDLQITKSRTGNQPRDVEYAVMPEPKEAVDPGILKTYEDMDIDLTALYRGEDPFAASKEADGDKLAEDAAVAIPS